MYEQRLQRGFFLGLLLMVTIAFLWLIGPFFKPIFWAVVLATLFYPTFQWWERRLRGRSGLASVGTIATIVLIVIVPLLLVGLLVASEASSVYRRLSTGQTTLPMTAQDLRDMLPAVAGLLEQFGVSLQDLQAQLSDAALGVSQFLATNVVAFGQNALRGTGLFFLTLYLLFFFLRDGARLLERIVGGLPIGDARERRLFQKFAEVSRATIKGTIVIGLVQGLLGGLIFWILGIEAAALWGVVMAVLSFLPAVGAALV